MKKIDRQVDKVEKIQTFFVILMVNLKVVMEEHQVAVEQEEEEEMLQGEEVLVQVALKVTFFYFINI